MAQTDQEDYAAYVAWKNSGSPQATLAPEREIPNIREVFKMLVHRAGLASEAVVKDFHQAIDDFVDVVEGKQDSAPTDVENDDETDPVTAPATADQTVPVDATPAPIPGVV